MFVVSTATLESELSRSTPALRKAASKLAALPAAKVALEYNKLNFESFDREIVEKSRHVLGVRATFGWHDVGSWEGLRHAIGDKTGNVSRGNVLTLDSQRVLAHSDSRLMVLFGVQDLVAVDTGDAILIAHRSQSGEVKRVTEELARRGLRRYL